MESTTTTKQTKDSQLHIRATTAELQEWQQAAEAMGFKTLTSFVRAAIVSFMLNIKVVPEVDHPECYNFLHSQEADESIYSQRVTNDEDILEMFGLS